MAYLNESGLAYFWSKLKNKFVAKETGKGLSTNDYSNDEKQKVAETSDTLAAHIADTDNPHKTPYHTPSYSTGTKIGTGSEVNDLYVPEASDKVKGVTIVWPEAQCTTFTSDSGTCTPAAVKKAVGMFVKQGTTDGTISVNGQNIAIPGFISYSVATEYTDSAINSLINGAPTTLDTLKEIADAMAENETVVEALDEAIGSKAAASDLTSHINNKNNPHAVTAAQVGLGNVENKSSATIREELTKANVTDALGYTPPTTDTTYSAATTSAAGLMSASDKTKLNGITSGATKNSISLGTSQSASSTSFDSTEITDPYIKLIDNSTAKGAIQLVGGDNITITRNTSGKIVVSASVESSDQHGNIKAVESAAGGWAFIVV